MSSVALIEMVSGLEVVSAGSVDTRVNTSPEMVRKGRVAGYIVYDREPQNVKPSVLPWIVLAVSLASSVYEYAARLTYASMSVIAG